MYTWKDLIDFVKARNLENAPFNEVMRQYDLEIEEYWKDTQSDCFIADSYIHEP